MLQRYKQFFYLTSNQFGAAAVIALFMMIIQYAPVLLKAVSDFDASQNFTLGSTTQYLDKALESLNKLPFVENLTTALLWGFVGLVAYTVFYLLANIFIDARNEIFAAAEHSVDGIDNREILWHAGGKLLAATLYLFFVGFTLIYLLKVWMGMAYVFIYSGMELANLPYLVGGYIGLTVNLYLLSVVAYLIWKNNETVVL